jgi:protein-disulfide isomerase
MKSETKIMIIIGFVSLLILIVGAVLYTRNAGPVGEIERDNPALIGNGETVIKAPNEKVVLVEFADLECPACRVAHPYVKQLLQEYQDSVTYVWRTFPIHTHSALASRSALIVRDLSGDPNKFFEMVDLMFEKQGEWEASSGARNQVEIFAGYAASMGVDVDKFREMINSNIYKDTIEQDNRDALSLGTNATPTFYINGKVVRGGNINQVKNLIDQEILAQPKSEAQSE